MQVRGEAYAGDRRNRAETFGFKHIPHQSRDYWVYHDALAGHGTCRATMVVWE
jgi:hypothetical protein